MAAQKVDKMVLMSAERLVDCSAVLTDGLKVAWKVAQTVGSTGTTSVVSTAELTVVPTVGWKEAPWVVRSAVQKVAQMAWQMAGWTVESSVANLAARRDERSAV